VYRSGAASGSAPEYRMVWKERDGREVVVDSSWGFRQTSFGDNAGWALSPDGRRVAIGLNTEAGDNIWVKHLPAGPVVRVTFDSASEYRPRWTPDGRAVLFGSNRPGKPGLFLRAADGTGSDSLVLGADIFEGQLSADGRWLVARGGGQLALVGGRDIVAMRLGLDTVPAPLVATRFDESELALSPDSRWIAYVSDETGRPEVYLRPFPDAASAKHQVTAAGGVAPVWSRNGREIFYITPQRDMVAVPVAMSPDGPALGTPHVLFRLDSEIYLAEREYYAPFDVSPDGRRFLMARRVSAEKEETASLFVTLNWFEELRRQVGNR
jgi:serine/threonine-protein kinase